MDINVVLRHLAKRHQWDRCQQAALAGIPHREVVYERDLSTSEKWGRAWNLVVEWLGLEAADLTTDLRPTHDRPLADIVENLADVLAAVSQSEWAHHVEHFDSGP